MNGLKFLKRILTRFKVIQPARCWRRKKILGFISMDIATVWEQPGSFRLSKIRLANAEEIYYRSPILP